MTTFKFSVDSKYVNEYLPKIIEIAEKHFIKINTNEDYQGIKVELEFQNTDEQNNFLQILNENKIYFSMSVGE
jgi:hypothetical protein